MDERISQLQPASANVRFSNHIEHLKPEERCREEVVARGEEYGRVLGDDLDYMNMIAAIEVRGAETEHFGAVAKKNMELPVLPTHDTCFQQFAFREGDGEVEGVDEAAWTSIGVLKLNHETLKGWRRAAIEVWLDPEVITNAADLREVLQAVTDPQEGRLPEFAFVVESITRQYLNEAHL